MPVLEKIRCLADFKGLDDSQLETLAQEVRDTLIAVTARNGGHIGPNLGVVELTFALHRVFDSPRDKFVFDVSHQGYVHKLLTGRQGEAFENIRQTDGLSGFLSPSESAHDSYGAGHAGTALSAALGMATARDKSKGGEDEHVVAVIGDASLTCGITLEALNNIKQSTDRLIVVLNDNEWSISKNVGSIAHYLNKLITNPAYNRLHNHLESLLNKLPGGESLIKLGSKAKKEAKDFILPSSLFEEFGLRYIGPIDGHNLPLLEEYLNFCKQSKEPVLLHVITTKGKGYTAAIEQPEKFHGTSPFDIATGKNTSSGKKSAPSYQEVFGQALKQFAQNNPRIIGITAAMPGGTGLKALADALPDQYFDVGIAEEHAVLFAAGLATQGFKPVCAIYSTFLQRAFDPIVHDVCLQNLPVVFCMDRAGLSPNDGPTHHGLFDIGYLRLLPNAIVMQPKDEDELVDMLHTSLQAKQPTFIRYPRGAACGIPMKDAPKTLDMGRAEILRQSDNDTLTLWALGPWVAEAEILAERLAQEANISATVVNARFAKPLDTDLLLKCARQNNMTVTLEDHTVIGGLGSAVIETLQQAQVMHPVLRFAWPDEFIPHGSSVDILREKAGLSTDTIYEQILDRYKQIVSP